MSRQLFGIGDKTMNKEEKNLCPLGMNILVGGRMKSEINEKIDNIP